MYKICSTNLYSPINVNAQILLISSKLPIYNDGKIESSKTHAVMNIIPQGTKALNSITVATVLIKNTHSANDDFKK
jgi:hypothetical protein